MVARAQRRLSWSTVHFRFLLPRDDVGVAADGLKYSELAKLSQAMNQVHHSS